MQTATDSVSPTALHFEAPPLTKRLVLGGNEGRQVRRNRVPSDGQLDLDYWCRKRPQVNPLIV